MNLQGRIIEKDTQEAKLAFGTEYYKGKDGKTPQKGTDYFTQEEIEQIETNAANKVKIPSALPNPNALTFTGAATGDYDGSSPVTINIPKEQEQVQSDWSINDETNPGYIKNRVCYTKDPIETEWLPETNVVNGRIAVSPWNKEVKPLTKYKVIIDGVETIIESSYNQIEIVGWAIGDIMNPPFFIPADFGEGLFLFSMVPNGKKVSINEIYEEPIKLPEKYLPDKILSPVGQTTPEGGEIFNAYSLNSASLLSHAEGQNTTASGDSSHAEGRKTTASGDGSHAEGRNTTASGYASHAEGENTTAFSQRQHVQGVCNIDDTVNKYAHIVGNGIPSGVAGRPDKLSNAHTLDWEGNSWYQGDVLIGGKDMDDPAAISLKKTVEKVDGIKIPTKLPNPNAIIFTGAVTDSYDGSKPLNVNIPLSQASNSTGKSFALMPGEEKNVEITEGTIMNILTMTGEVTISLEDGTNLQLDTGSAMGRYLWVLNPQMNGLYDYQSGMFMDNFPIVVQPGQDKIKVNFYSMTRALVVLNF